MLKSLENEKGLYVTMNRWRIDPWLYGDIRNFYLLHTLYVFICYAKIMPASAMKACFLIAERRTIFCKDTLNICNFQIFRAVFYIEEWNFLFYNKAKGGGNNWTFARFAPFSPCLNHMRKFCKYSIVRLSWQMENLNYILAFLQKKQFFLGIFREKSYICQQILIISIFGHG